MARHNPVDSAMAAALAWHAALDPAPPVTLLVTGLHPLHVGGVICEHWQAVFAAQVRESMVLLIRGMPGSPCDPRNGGIPPLRHHRAVHGG